MARLKFNFVAGDSFLPTSQPQPVSININVRLAHQQQQYTPRATKYCIWWPGFSPHPLEMMVVVVKAAVECCSLPRARAICRYLPPSGATRRR